MLDDVLKAEEFDIFLRDGWNADVLSELMDDVRRYLTPETSINVFKALDTKVRDDDTPLPDTVGSMVVVLLA